MGTIEVRISVLRYTGETYALTDANQGYKVQDWYEQHNRKGGYNSLPPSYEMELREGLFVDLTKTENGLGSGRARPLVLALHHGLSFVSSIVPKVCGKC